MRIAANSVCAGLLFLLIAMLGNADEHRAQNTPEELFSKEVRESWTKAGASIVTTDAWLSKIGLEREASPLPTRHSSYPGISVVGTVDFDSVVPPRRPFSLSLINPRAGIRLPSFEHLMSIVVYAEDPEGFDFRSIVGPQNLRRILVMGTPFELSEGQSSERPQADRSPEKIAERMGWDALACHTRLEVLSLFDVPIDDSGIEAIAALPKLRHLCLQGVSISAKGIELLARLKNLESLELSSSSIHAKSFQPLARLPRLRFLALGGSEVEPGSIRSIAALSGLQGLDLTNIPVNDDDLAALSRLRKLTLLELSNYSDDNHETLLSGFWRTWMGRPFRGSRVTDRGIRYLSRLENLEYLFLHGTRVSGRGIESVAQLPKLKSIAIDKIDDVTLVTLARARNLHVLRQFFDGRTLSGSDGDLPSPAGSEDEIRSAHLGGTSVTDRGLRALAGLKNLTFLDLSYTQVQGFGLRYLAGCSKLEKIILHRSELTSLADLPHLPALRVLNLFKTRIPGSQLRYLSRCPKLETLRLSQVRISDADLEPIAALPHLKLLDLSSTPITGEGLKYVSKCSQLESLDLTGTKLTDGSLIHVGRMKKLKGLSLRGTRVGDAGIQHLVGAAELSELDLEGTAISDSAALSLLKLKKLSYVFTDPTDDLDVLAEVLGNNEIFVNRRIGLGGNAIPPGLLGPGGGPVLVEPGLRWLRPPQVGVLRNGRFILVD